MPKSNLLPPITWTTEKRRIGDLVEWEKNPRRLTEKQAEGLRDSLLKFGYVEPVVVNHDGKSMIGGHQRRRVMQLFLAVDPTFEIDVRIPSRELTPEEREELAIRLNKNTGEWDFDILANEFDEDKLIAWGFEAPEFGMEAEKNPASMGDQNQKHDFCPKCKRAY